jgi:hypothetical protein
MIRDDHRIALARALPFALGISRLSPARGIMSLKIQALSGVKDKGKLNGEWILLLNDSETAFNTEGCSISVGKVGARPRTVTTIQAGLILRPKETCRLISGSSGKTSHGTSPPEEEGVRNIHLFLKGPYLERAGLVVRLMNKQLELCRAVYDPNAPAGVLSTAN